MTAGASKDDRRRNRTARAKARGGREGEWRPEWERSVEQAKADCPGTVKPPAAMEDAEAEGGGAR